MKTKKIFLLITLLLTFVSFAQGKMQEKKEQIRALKVGFIANELALTADEAAKFWPLFNDYDDKKFELKHQKTKAFEPGMEADLDHMSEKEASSLLAQMENNEDVLYKNRKKFTASLKGILPTVKIIKLKKAEDDFNKKLLQQYRNKRPKQ
jgi:Spy/CpxP family protein refolding chaperone